MQTKQWKAQETKQQTASTMHSHTLMYIYCIVEIEINNFMDWGGKISNWMMELRILWYLEKFYLQHFDHIGNVLECAKHY